MGSQKTRFMSELDAQATLDGDFELSVEYILRFNEIIFVLALAYLC